MASFVRNNWKGHFGISVNELCFKNALDLLINNRSNFRKERIIVWKSRSDFSRGANYRAKIRDESSSKANYHAKNHADQNSRCHENAGRFRWNIVSSEISWKAMKSQEFRLNSFALLLHSTVQYFAVKDSSVNEVKENRCPPLLSRYIYTIMRFHLVILVNSTRVAVVALNNGWTGNIL